MYSINNAVKNDQSMSRSDLYGHGTVVLAGCGYTGHRVGVLWQEAGYRVWCLVRSDDSAVKAKDQGFNVMRIDLDSADSFPEMPSEAAIICYFVPPSPSDKDIRLWTFLRLLERNGIPKTFLYISTSGVYGDVQGDWVTEETPLHPETARAKRRVEAEQTLQRWATDRPVRTVILRVPAIYGPHRIPVQRIREKIPVLRREDAPYSNRIHVDDLAAICVKTAVTGDHSEIFNVSDGDPQKVTDYYFTLADMLGLEHPPTISMEEAIRTLSPMRLSFLRESRRIVNRKLVASLGISLRYPTLKAGLKASLEEMDLLS